MASTMSAMSLPIHDPIKDKRRELGMDDKAWDKYSYT
jgi:hypothetical protein